MIELNQVNTGAIDGQMMFDGLVYTWTSSERRDGELNVCTTIIDEDAHLELWFKEETRTLCEVCVVTIGKNHDFRSPQGLPQSNGLIRVESEIIRRPRGAMQHCLKDDIKSYISVATSDKKIELDFGDIHNADTQINGPNITQFRKESRLVGLSFLNFQIVDPYFHKPVNSHEEHP